MFGFYARLLIIFSKCIRNLLLVIKGTLIFLKKHGFTQGQVSSFIDEELRAQVNFCKTTVNVWFGMANKINKKDQ